MGWPAPAGRAADGSTADRTTIVVASHWGLCSVLRTSTVNEYSVLAASGRSVVTSSASPSSAAGRDTMSAASVAQRDDVRLPLIDGGAPTITGPFNWGDHPFGQDSIGRDYFAMTMRGTQNSIIIMFIIGALAGLVGVVVGVIGACLVTYFKTRSLDVGMGR